MFLKAFFKFKLFSKWCIILGGEIMISSSKQRIFEKLAIPKAVLLLAIPTILSSLVMVIYNLADTYFVGLLDNPIQNAAVTLAAPVLLSFNAINNLFGIGTSSLMSRSLGEKKYEKVKRCSVFGFYSSLFFGLLISLGYTIFSKSFLGILGADSENIKATGDYLTWTTTFGAIPSILNVVMANLVRSEGSTFHASIGTMTGCLLNIILDPFFILPFGLNMGASGAGLATFISNSLACLYFFILLFVRRNSTNVSINPKLFKFNKEITLGIFAVGIPAAIQNLLNVTGMTVLNNFTSSFGSNAVAAMGISYKINMIPMYISMGLSQGIMPLISYNYASKNYKRVKNTFYFSFVVYVSFLVLTSFFYGFCSHYFVSLFIETKEVVDYGSRFMKGMCLALPFLCIDFLAVGVFQAIGMGKLSLLFAILRKIFLEIPALILLNYLFPLYGLAYAQFIAEIILAIVAIIVILKLFAKWNKSEENISLETKQSL